MLYKFSKMSELIAYTKEIRTMSPEEQTQHFTLLNSMEQYEVLGKNLPEVVKNALTAGNLPYVDAKNGSILLTGARGFLGSYLLSELLEKTKNRIFCIVRPHGNQICLFF
jgi:Na+-transporting NADH:ubiquinone oxidoreductase subunit NqrB